MDRPRLPPAGQAGSALRPGLGQDIADPVPGRVSGVPQEQVLHPHQQQRGIPGEEAGQPQHKQHRIRRAKRRRASAAADGDTEGDFDVILFRHLQNGFRHI
ncbi:Hypothetical_protein [Hexamita inflata]|uniref:Hypothetical_protein n=1 Tax=Hexamita inflata TaxID=28002 RepID=A0AA86Q1F8_9EUKA|nr:Hypothetical protein HINF_LOCUS37925 [Hexamita inflata]